MIKFKQLILLVLLFGASHILLNGDVEGQIRPEVNNTTKIIDDKGWVRIFGESENTNTDNVTIQMLTTFRDVASEIVATDTGYPYLDLLTPSQKSPFEAIFPVPSEASQVSTWDFAPTTGTRATSPYRNFTITQESNSTDGTENFRISGVLNNTGDFNATFVQVIATFYSQLTLSKVLYADWVYVTPINLTAGNSGTFEITALNGTYNLGNIGNYALVFQCNEYYPTDPGSTDNDFSLDAMPRNRSVVQGNAVEDDIHLAFNPSLEDIVPDPIITLTASGLPEDASYTFVPTNTTTSLQSMLRITPSNSIGVGIGNFSIKIRAEVGGVIRQVPVVLTVLEKTGFSLTIDPSSRTISQGNDGAYTITVKSGGGFSSQVTLSVSNIPTDSTAGFDPTIVTPTSQGNQSTLTISTTLTTSTGTFTFIVNGTTVSQNETISASIAVTVPTEGYFELDIDPNERTVFRGTSTIFTVTVQSFNSFNSAVSLNVSGLPTDLTASFMPSPITPPANGELTSTLTITAESDADIDSYALTITGTSTGVATKTVQATISVSAFSEPDFALYVQPASLSIIQNNSGTATIQVVSVNGFSDSVDLSVQGLPTGVTSSIEHPVVAPLPSGNVITTLTIQTSSSANIGDYTFTVKGESDTQTHSETIELIIQNITFRSPFGQCIIATTAYGSELSPEVQFLRGFRDNRVLSTIAGVEFMKAFNAWYYSFSPQVATWIYDNPVVKEPMKILLAPLLGTLHLSEITYSTFGFAPELAVTTSGIVASLLIGLIYVGPIVTFAHKKIHYGNMWKILKLLTITSVGSLFFMGIGLILSLFTLIMITSSTLVLSMMMLGALLPTLALLEFLKRRHQLSN